jgi:hypothetical protein
MADAQLCAIACQDWLLRQAQSFIRGRNGKRRATLQAAEYVMARRAGEGGAADITMMVPRQGDLFIDPWNLKDGHSLEGGTGHMHRTRHATYYDFQGFLRIRDKAIEADIKYRNRMRRAMEHLGPIWVNDPMMTYEEACNLYVRMHGMPEEEGDDESED